MSIAAPVNADQFISFRATPIEEEELVGLREEKVFCPTGPGGGVDATCKPGGASANQGSSFGSATGDLSPQELSRVFPGVSDGLLDAKLAFKPDGSKEEKYDYEAWVHKGKTIDKLVAGIVDKVSEIDVKDHFSFGVTMKMDNGKMVQADGDIAYRKKLVEKTLNAWAESSGGVNGYSVGLQKAITEEFGDVVPELKRAPTGHMGDYSKNDRGEPRPDGAPIISLMKKEEEAVVTSTAVRVILRTQYEATQEHFKKLGITEVVLHRGYREKEAAVDGPVSIVLQPASSFSLSRTIGLDFAQAGDSVYNRLITVTVPVERVLSIPGTGMGCLGEQEVVLLGGKIDGDLAVGVKQ